MRRALQRWRGDPQKHLKKQQHRSIFAKKKKNKNTSEEGGATSQHTVNSSTASNCISHLETHVILYVNMLMACYLSLSSWSYLAQLSDNFRRTASFHRPFQRHTSCFGPFKIIDQCFCCLCHYSVRVDRTLQTVLRFSCERRVHSEFVRFTPSPMPVELADQSLHLTGVSSHFVTRLFSMESSLLFMNTSTTSRHSSWQDVQLFFPVARVFKLLFNDAIMSHIKVPILREAVRSSSHLLSLFFNHTGWNEVPVSRGGRHT